MATKLNNCIFFDFPVVEEKSEYENLKTKIKSLSPFFIEVKEGVSKSFSIEIKAYAPRNGNCLNVNDLNSLLNQNIRVLVTQSDNDVSSNDAYARVFGGILTSYKNKFIGTDLVVYTLFIESKLSNLSVAFNNETHRFVRQNEVRFHHNTEVKSVLKDIVLNSTFDKPTFNRNFISVSDEDFKYLSHLFFIQDNESYQEFLDKICIYYGVNYNLSFMIDVGSKDLGDINSFVENYALRENINFTTSNDLCVSEQVYKVTFGKDNTGTSTPIFNNSSDESSKINCSFSNANKDLLRDETNDPYLLTDCENNFLSKELNSSINLSLNNSLDVLIKSTIIHQKIKYKASTNDSYVDTELKLRQKNFENLIESLSFTQIFNDLNNLAFACGKVITLDKENYLIARNSFYFYIDNFDNLDDKTRTANNAAHESLSTLLGNDLKNNEIHQSILTIPVNDKGNFGYLGILPLLEVDDSNYADKILNIDFGSYFTKNNSYLREFEAIVCDDSGDYVSNKGKICVETSEDSLGYASTCYAYVGTYNKGVDEDNKSIDENIVIPVECVFKDENNFPVIGQKIIVSRNNGEFVFNKYSKHDVINEELVLSRDLRNDLLNSGRLYHRNDNKNYDFNDYNVRSGSFDVTHFSSFKSYLEYLIIEGQISDYVSNLTKLNGESKYLDHYKKGDELLDVEIFPFSQSGFEFYSECSDGTIAYVEVDKLYVDVKKRYSDNEGEKEDKTGNYYKYKDKESKKEKVYENKRWYKKNDLDTVKKSDYSVDELLKKYIYIDGENLTANSTSLKNYCSGVSKAYKALQKDSAHTISRVDLSKDLSNAVTYVYDLVLTAVYLGLDRKGLYNSVISYAESQPTSSIYKNSNEIFIKTSDGDLNITSGNNLVINSGQKLTINAKSIELKGTNSIKLKTGGSSITLEPRELNLKQIGTASPFIDQLEGDGDWGEHLSKLLNVLTGICSNASLTLSGNEGATLSGYKANVKGMLSASVKDSFGGSLQAKVGGATVGGLKATLSSKIGQDDKINLVVDVAKKVLKLLKQVVQVGSTGENYDEIVNSVFGTFDFVSDVFDAGKSIKDFSKEWNSDADDIKAYDSYVANNGTNVMKLKKDAKFYNEDSVDGLTPFAIAHSALEGVISCMEHIEDIVLNIVLKTLISANNTSNNYIARSSSVADKDRSNTLNEGLEMASYVAVRIFSLIKYVTAYCWIFALRWSSPEKKVKSKIENVPSKISLDTKFLSTTAVKNENTNSPVAGGDRLDYLF